MPAYSEEVIIRGDASQLEAALKRASGAVTASAATWSAKLSAVGKSMTDLGRKMQSFGRSARTHVTLPILAIGAVATKMALDFEQAFTRIDAVSNASAKQIASWRGEVEKLAVATARDPRELADALYFLASAGLKAADIMPTLEMAAKAAASGLGETKDIARLLAVTLNNYAESGLTAAEATDTLVAAVKAGSAEPDEFADAMGRILPIAAKAGVEFEEIAASLAALSSAGLAVNEGVTAMRGLLAALIAPGSQAAETLKEIGLSADEVRRAIAEDGLQGALILLDEAADGNIDTLRKIIPNIRALTGQFALTGDRAKATALVFDQVANSTGAMDEAFATTAEGPGFKLAQGLTKLKVAAIALGEQLIPIALEVVGVVSDIAESFGRLSKGTQGTIIKVGLLAAAIGPGVGLLGGLLRLGGGLVKGVAWLGGFRAAATAAAGAAGTASAATGTAGLAGALAGLVSPIGLVVGATALLAGGWLTYRDDANRAADATRALGAALFDGRLSLDQFRAAMDAEIAAIEDADLRMALLARQTQIAAGATEIYNRRIHDLAAAYDLTGETAGIFYDAMARGVDLTIKQREQIAAALHGLNQFGVGLSATEKMFFRNAIATGDFAGAMEVLNGKLDKVVAKLQRDYELRVDDKAAQQVITNFIARNDGRHITIIMDTATGVLHGGHAALGGIAGAARGALIPQAATGFITQAPALLVGEGRSATPAGIGAEAVIPLDSRGVRILSRALGQAMAQVSGAQRPTLVISGNHFVGGGRDFADLLGRTLVRMMNEGA